jgi:hypothetical protein
MAIAGVFRQLVMALSVKKSMAIASRHVNAMGANRNTPIRKKLWIVRLGAAGLRTGAKKMKGFCENSGDQAESQPKGNKI